MNIFLLPVLRSVFTKGRDEKISFETTFDIFCDKHVMAGGNKIYSINDDQTMFTTCYNIKRKADSLDFLTGLVEPGYYKTKYYVYPDSHVIQEFFRYEDKIFFHIVFTKDEYKNRFYVSQFKRGEYKKGEEAANFEFNYTNLLIDNYDKYVFVLSDSIKNKVKLDKCIEHYEFTCFYNELSELISDLFEPHFKVLENIRRLSVRKPEFWHLFNEIIEFYIFKNLNNGLCSMDICNQYKSDKYELLSTDSDIKYLSDEVLNNIEDLLVKNNDKYIEKIVEIKKQLSKELGSYNSDDCNTYISQIEDITEAFKTFKEALEEKKARDEKYIKERNNKIKKSNEENPKNDSENQKIENLLKLYKYLYNYVLLKVEEWKIFYYEWEKKLLPFHKDCKVTYYEWEDKKDSVLASSKAEIYKIEEFLRIKLNLETFKAYPSYQTIMTLLNDRDFKRIQINNIVPDLEYIRKMLEFNIENLSKSLSLNLERFESFKKLLKICIDCKSKWSKIEKTNLSFVELLSEENIIIPEETPLEAINPGTTASNKDNTTPSNKKDITSVFATIGVFLIITILLVISLVLKFY
ncbi:hypothetical protein NGRA_0457 [Nosema granulosis]|uniref:Uncharacterized protein n=1 Tax=Nosema granulosis TaxID=83296 RepID=A0A9P6H0W3_9MICR|nr:hypothetical protein NGRA_0457 [Nosema granulosis]